MLSDPRERQKSTLEMPVTPLNARFFPHMSPLPDRYQGPFGLHLRLVGGARCFDAHASTKLWFRVPSGASRLLIEFGMLRDSYMREGARTDGVEFVATLRQPNHEGQVLCRRLLEPDTHPADRPLQRMEAVFPPSSGDAELIVETRPGPSGSNAFDWAYLKSVRIE